MRRPSLWLIVVVLLLGALLVRERQLQKVDDIFLRWFAGQSTPQLSPSEVTLVEVTRQDFESFPILATNDGEAGKTTEKKILPRTISPLEYALFLQAALEFQPAVIGLEPIVVWRDRDKDQEQVFIDQAMRVPKLLVAMQLGEKTSLDLSNDDILSFSQVTGERSALAEFPGISHRPDDDIRLISTPGFTDLPAGRDDPIRVRMLFQYRGDVVPSFPLQAILLWLRATPAEVKIDLGSQILLPNGWKIPIQPDGTTAINPLAAENVRRLTLNQLLLAAQEHEAHRAPTIDLTSLKDQIIILRIADDPLQPPNIFATAMAAIQTNAYLRRVPPLYDWLVVTAAAILGCFLWTISKANLCLSALALSAGYTLLVLAMLSQYRLWLPTFLPLTLLWFLVLVRLFIPETAAGSTVSAGESARGGT